jgi:SHS2 domain-containing protein
MGSEPRFSLEAHTADVAVAATAPDLGSLFAAVADGLTAAMCDDVPDGGDRFTLTARGESLEALLFEYLDELIYQRDVRGVVPCDHRAAVEEADGTWVVDASARGLPFGAVDAREVKAVTYSEMTVAEFDRGWRAYVVLDV